MNIQAVLFDLDGTLVDSAQDFIAILQTMRHERGMPAIETQQIRQQASSGANAMVQAGLEIEPDNPAFAHSKADFLQRYQDSCAVHTRPFAGIMALLDYLEQQDIAWGVATNKPVQFAKPLLQQLNLLQRMSVLACPEHVKQSKPAPDMLLLACEKLGVAPQQTLYLGDDLRDIQAAKAAHMPSVAVGYGYHPPHSDPKQWGAECFIAQSEQLLTELKPLLLNSARTLDV